MTPAPISPFSRANHSGPANPTNHSSPIGRSIPIDPSGLSSLSGHW
jgi:hypothetical protein